MKKRLLLLIFSLLLPTKINADIDRDIFKFCINKNDFDNCVEKLKEFKDFNSEILGKEDFKNPYGDPSEWSTQEYKFWEKECRKLNMVFVEKKLLCDSLGVFNEEEYIWKKGRYRKKKN